MISPSASTSVKSARIERSLQRRVVITGVTHDAFEACLKDQKLYEAVNAMKTRGADVMKVDANPTFFINGKKLSGEMSVEEFEKVIKPILGA